MDTEQVYDRYRELQSYVGWGDDDVRRVAAVAPLVEPYLPALIDDFYEEIERHPLKNVITKAVGAKETIEPQAVEQTIQNGDLALICSDGLHSMITDDAIQAIMVTYEKKALADGCAALIAAALEAGGKDNVSVILLRYSE